MSDRCIEEENAFIDALIHSKKKMFIQMLMCNGALTIYKWYYAVLSDATKRNCICTNLMSDEFGRIRNPENEK